MSAGLRNRVFEALESVDCWLHSRGIGPGWFCRLVGRLEVGYYERTTDWDNPLYVDPVTHPELYLRFADSLCAHGYRDGENCEECAP